jgi:hypothetical protein
VGVFKHEFATTHPTVLAPSPSPRGAGDGIRTRDIQLGRLELYQLSYTRQSRLLRSLLLADITRWWGGKDSNL